MYQVRNLYTAEFQCVCNSLTKAIEIAHALKAATTEEMEVIFNNSVKFDTRNGQNES